jgi:hypothetical protein
MINDFSLALQAVLGLIGAVTLAVGFFRSRIKAKGMNPFSLSG